MVVMEMAGDAFLLFSRKKMKMFSPSAHSSDKLLSLIWIPSIQDGKKTSPLYLTL